jgi:hypothetical protein
MLLVGAWIAKLFERRRAVGVLAIASVIAMAIPCIVFLAISSSERSRNTLAVWPTLDRAGGAVLYTDYYGVRLIRLLSSSLPDTRVWFHANFEANEIVLNARPEEESGALVLLDRQMAKIYTSSYEMKLPPSIGNPPSTWSVVWRHRAYSEGSFSRQLLEGVRSLLTRLPGFALKERINRNIAEMIDNDDATLYRVP